jgi:hypothetical protein
MYLVTFLRIQYFLKKKSLEYFNYNISKNYNIEVRVGKNNKISAMTNNLLLV